MRRASSRAGCARGAGVAAARRVVVAASRRAPDRTHHTARPAVPPRTGDPAALHDPEAARRWQASHWDRVAVDAVDSQLEQVIFLAGGQVVGRGSGRSRTARSSEEVDTQCRSRTATGSPTSRRVLAGCARCSCSMAGGDAVAAAPQPRRASPRCRSLRAGAAVPAPLPRARACSRRSRPCSTCCCAARGWRSARRVRAAAARPAARRAHAAASIRRGASGGCAGCCVALALVFVMVGVELARRGRRDLRRHGGRHQADPRRAAVRPPAAGT